VDLRKKSHKLREFISILSAGETLWKMACVIVRWKPEQSGG